MNMNGKSTMAAAAALVLGCLLSGSDVKAGEQDALGEAFGSAKTLMSAGGFEARGVPIVLDHVERRWPDEGRSWGSASSICRNVWDSFERDNCDRIVRRARFFSSEALPLCRMLHLDRDKVRCLEVIADHNISSYDARACGDRRDDVSMMDCLRRAGRWSPDRPFPDRDRPFPDDRPFPGRGDGMDAALNVCGRFSFDSSKMDCMQAVRRARFFSTDAVVVCGGLTYDSNKLDCLKKIQDKPIDSRIARMCGQMSFDSDKVRCLGNN